MGMLAGRRFRYARRNGYVLSSDADFVITGIIRKQKKKPEGPFGDHLGYYSLTHDFPVMEVEKVEDVSADPGNKTCPGFVPVGDLDNREQPVLTGNNQSRLSCCCLTA